MPPPPYLIPDTSPGCGISSSGFVDCLLRSDYSSPPEPPPRATRNFMLSHAVALAPLYVKIA